MLVFAKMSKLLGSSLLLGLAMSQVPVANAAVYPMPPAGNDIVGQVITVRSGSDDTLLTIGNRYGVGMHEMLEANPQLHRDQETATNYLGRGKEVIVPTQYVLPVYRKGIVVNLPELRIYYFTPDHKYVYTYPVGLGRMGWRTPLTATTVISKEKDPVWNVPPSIHAYVLEETGKDLPDSIPPGPENPLGPYAMHLGANGYLIHGTNQPWSIGKYVSSGCIRMHDEDVTELYHMVTVGTPVYIVNHAVRAGWDHGKLYLEAQMPLQLDAAPGPLNPSLQSVVASKANGTNVDWDKVAAVVNAPTGIPQLISGGTEPGQGGATVAQGAAQPAPNYSYNVNQGNDNQEVVKVINVEDQSANIRDSREVNDIISKTPGVVELTYYEN